MEEIYSISTTPPADTAFDYEALRQKAIEYIRNTASSVWTDYNIHDPGITSLEILCYAITDLSYRSSFSIPDLMRQKDDTADKIISEFFTAKKIFPNKALTTADYRKLLINVKGVKNAWLRKKTKRITADITNKRLTAEAPAASVSLPVAIKGFYDVLLEFDTDISAAEDQQKIISEIKALLQANRNLAEDFDEIKKVDQQFFRLCCELEVNPGADLTETVAELFFQIQLHLSPLVKFYTLQEMLTDKQGYATGRIFEGPFIEKGFIKDTELVASELKKEIHLSDLMQIILNNKNITGIPEILFTDIHQTKESASKWIISVNKQHQPVVDIKKSNIVAYKNGTPVRLSMQKIENRFSEMMTTYLRENEKKFSEDILFNTGSYRQVNNYHSIQHHFPKAYGISHWGLPPEATIERQKQAKQLQGYLLMFDQLLANYLMQLSSVKNIFSLKDEQHTFFTQLVKDFKDPTYLFSSYTETLNPDGTLNETESWKNSAEAIGLAAEEPGSKKFYRRRNIFLDHLLSRFAESFYDYVSIYQDQFPLLATDKKVTDIKRAFLENYPEYSSCRAAAYNYTLADKTWDTAENISGFEKRAQRLLGFENISRRSLVNLYSEITEEVQADGTSLFSFSVRDNRNNKTLLSADEKFNTRLKAQQELQVALTLCSTPAGMKVVKDDADSKFLIEVRDKLNTLIAAGEKGTKSAAEAGKKRITELLASMTEEGMFLIEHLLLFDKNSNVFMPVCVDPNCSECNDTDPYSFRISIVMPAYASRFRDMEFRSYCEKLMREEMPAHLLVKICWIDNEQLHELEEAYKDWLPVKAGAAEDVDGKKLQRLIEIVKRMKSVYPESELQICGAEEQQQLFILNKNSLGTQKSS
jgi:hypothetical protein